MNTVQPIRSKRKVQAIKNMLKGADKPRDYLLFGLALNTALRIGDLLELQVKDVVNSKDKIRGKLQVKENKTGKSKTIKLNGASREALEYFFNHIDKTDRDRYLFKSHRSAKPIDRYRAYDLINKWCEDVGLTEGSYGCHTTRKTWGYLARTEHGIPIEKIQAKLGHNTPATTKRYLGITQEEINGVEDQVEI